MGNTNRGQNMNKYLSMLIVTGLMVVSNAGYAGTGNFVVPPCNADAVIETALSLAQTKDVVNPRTVRFRNIRQVTYYPNRSRSCVATIKDNRNRDIDFFYQVIMTNGVKWVVGGVDL